MTYEEAKVLADKIKSANTQNESLYNIAQREDLVKEYVWCERECERCDFLTEYERVIYFKALFNAVLWGNK
jgi:hypothetical protein